MKRFILFFITLFLFILSTQAQKRYSHLRRTKVEKVSLVVDKEQKPVLIQEETVPAAASTSESILDPKQEVLVNTPSPVNKMVEITQVPKQKKVDETKDVSSTFFQKVFKTHKRLSDVKNVEKTNLRAWKWLVIGAAILVAIGIVLLILVSNLPHPASSFALAFGLGCVVVGVLLILIFLILGLTGRI